MKRRANLKMMKAMKNSKTKAKGALNLEAADDDLHMGGAGGGGDEDGADAEVGDDETGGGAGGSGKEPAEENGTDDEVEESKEKDGTGNAEGGEAGLSSMSSLAPDMDWMKNPAEYSAKQIRRGQVVGG